MPPKHEYFKKMCRLCRKRSYESDESEDEEPLSKRCLVCQKFFHTGFDLINQLSDEVLVKIFGYCSSNDLFARIALVNKRFERLSKDRTLLKEIYLRASAGREPQLSKYTYDALISFGDFVSTLKIHKRSDVEYLIEIALKHCQNLKQLEIRDCTIRNNCVIHIIENGKCLEQLNFKGSTFVYEHEIETPDEEIVGHLPNLKSLELLYVDYNDEILVTLANNCHNLTYLCVVDRNYHISESVLLTFLLHNQHSLQSLSLGVELNIEETFFQGDVVEHFFELLGDCQNLEFLKLSMHGIMTKDFNTQFITAISKMKKLTELIIGASAGASSECRVSLFNRDGLTLPQETKNNKILYHKIEIDQIFIT